MTKIVLALILCVFALSAATSAQKIEIYTYDTLPPLAFRDGQGNLTGVYIEIIKTALSKMPDYDVAFNVVPWARAKAETKSGNAFAILPPYFHAHDWLTDTEPRRPYIWPYSLPLFTQYDVVICNQSALYKPRVNFPYDFQGLRFVMWRGDGRAGPKFDKLVATNKIKIQLVKDVKSTIPFLLKRRADCTIASKLPFAWYIKQMKKTGEYQQINTGVILKEAIIISSNDGYLGYTDINDEKNFPFKKDFSIKFDTEIYRLKKSGKIKEIVSRFVD